MRARLILLATVAVGAAFVFWHSGGRADAVCRRELFVPADGLSPWPPGARCIYGEPATSDVVVNPWFIATLVVIAMVVMGLAVRRSAHTAAVHR